MNAFNRIVLLIVALLMVVIPVLLILVALGVISAGLIDQYTGYQSGLQALGGLSASAIGSTARIILAVVGAILALLALLLLLRELTFGKRVSRSTKIEDTPGRETVITASAVKALSEGAAREAGAESPSVSLASEGSSEARRPYSVACNVRVPQSGNYTEIATRTRDNIRRTLENQGVPVGNVEVTVQGTAS
jgi:hypothetical protein